MQNQVIELKKNDLNYKDIYSGNIKSWFPNLRKERVEEFTEFINGIVAITRKLHKAKNNPCLINPLATYASASLFTDADSQIKSLFYFDLYTNIEQENKSSTIVVDRIRDSFVRLIKGEPLDIEQRIDSYYSSIASFSRSELEKTEYDNSIEIIYEDKKILYPQLEQIVNINPTNRFSNFRDEEVVGNKNAIKSIMTLMNILACYNLEKRENPILNAIPFSKLITLLGAAGTGKTMIITKALDYLANKCAELNKPFVFLPINADTKSEYKSLSERQLKKKFDIAYKGDSINIILIEEVDTKIFSRNNIDNKNSAEQSFTGTFLEAIEGTDKYLGNFGVIITSNRRTNPDKGIKRRFMENVVYATGLETGEDHITIFRNKLRKGIEKNYIQINDWERIGEQSIKNSFQGGDIKNICLRINKNILANLDFNTICDNLDNFVDYIPIVKDEQIIHEINQYKKDSLNFSKDFLKEDN